MEAVLIVFGALLVPFEAAGIAALLGGLLLLAQLAFETVLGKRIRATRPALVRNLRIAVLGLFGLSLLGLVLACGPLFATSVRLIADRVEGRTGIAISYGSVDGSLWAGDLTFQDLVAKGGAGTCRVDLRAARLHFDIAMLPALLGRAGFETIELEDVRGEVEHVASAAPREERGLPEVAADAVLVRDVQVRVRDLRDKQLPLDVALAVEALDTRPLHGASVWFALLFRTNAKGSLDGAPFAIATSGDGAGRKTRWTMKGLPLKHALPYCPWLRPFLAGGEIDVDADATWSLGEGIVIHTQWFVTLRDPKARLRGGAGTPAERKLFELVNGSKGSLRLELGFDVQQDDFAGHASLATLPLLAALGDLVAETLGARAGLDAAELKALHGTVRAAGKNALDHGRVPR